MPKYVSLSYNTRCLTAHLTIESVEASPDKLVVVRDFVDNSSKTAHTVLDHLKTGRKTIMSSVCQHGLHLHKASWFNNGGHNASFWKKKKEAHRHAVFDDELHEVFFDGGKERFTGMLHQRYHKLQDLCHVTDDHEVIGSLQGKQYDNNYWTKSDNDMISFLFFISSCWLLIIQ